MTKQTFPSTVQIAGDLGGTPASPQVTGAHFGGSDGQYMIRRSGLWAPAVPSYADLSSVPASFTPSAHATSHNVGGSDATEDLTRLAAGPAIHGYLAWTFDPYAAIGTVALAAGWIFVSRLLTTRAYVVSSIDFYIGQAGTGVTSLANCFIGLYDSGGTRRYVSADQSSAWATSGAKSISLGGSAYTVTANDAIYIAVLVGTQATTVVRFQSFAASAATAQNINLSGASLRFATNGSGASALPGSFTPSSAAASGSGAPFFAVK